MYVASYVRHLYLVERSLCSNISEDYGLLAAARIEKIFSKYLHDSLFQGNKITKY